jgi:large subunit ribosomal protein L25
MSSKNDALAIETRAASGTTASQALRKTGKIPGVLFGHGSAPMPIAFDAKTFDELLHSGGRNRLLQITLDGGARDTALIREVQRDPVTRSILHADFQRVRATEEISATLPIVAVGTAAGVKDFGGIMEIVSRTIDVRGPANALPEQIEIDVSALGIHDHISASDVKLPAGIAIETDPGTVMIAIAAPTVQEEEAPAPAAAEVPTVAETSTES